MRNFLSHEYADVDPEAIFRTIREDIPAFLVTARNMRDDLRCGDLDDYIKKNARDV